jgi:PAS domain S-box-containing protein
MSHRRESKSSNSNFDYLAQLGAITLLAFIILTVLLFSLGNKTVYESKTFLAISNIIFLSALPFAVAYISSFSYLRSGLLQLLFLGGAMVTFGICNLIAAWGILSVTSPEGTNFLVTVHNSGVLVFGIVTFAASILSSTKTSRLNPNAKNRKLSVVLAYSTATVLAIILAALTLAKDTPPFVVLGEFTLLRQSILIVAVVLLFSSAFLFGKKYFDTKSRIVYWYALGLGLIGIGIIGILIEPHLGTPLSWIGRAAQYVGCVFFVIAALNKLPKSGVEVSWVEAFRSDRLQLSNLFSKMLDGFAYHKIETDDQGKPTDYVFLEVNDAFEKVTGLKRENIIGKKATQAIPGIEKDPADWIGLYGHVALTGEPIQFENYAQPLDRWFRVSAYSPERTYFVALFEDITARKKAEEELLAVNERFEMAQRAAGVGVWDWDVKSGKISWSAEMFRLFGLDPKENVASFAEWEKVLHPEDKEKAGFKIQQALKEKSFLDNNYRIVRPNGQIIWINALGKGEYGNQGEPIRMSGICVDIRARKLAEERLEEYQKNLEKLVEERTKQLKDSERLAAIGATAGMVGHDIRNPLQAITSDVYLAKTELATIPESDEKNSIKESLTEIEKNIDYINKIVQDLQDYARPLNPNPGEADLKLIIDRLLTKNGLPKNVKVTVKVEPEVRKFVADADYLNRILYNLVTNAVQAMPKGGKLMIVANNDANDIVVAVKDTGVGIPKEIQGKMFTPMFTTKSKGQGFGLPVVKRMTESLGGTVTFESEEGKGTTFFVRLPLKKN